MALKARIDAETHKSLPDAIKAEYKEDGDEFILDVTPVGGYELQDISGLRTTLQKLKTKVTDAEKLIKGYEIDGTPVDPATVKDLLAKFKKLGDLSPEQLAEQKVKAALEQQQTQFNTQMSAKETRIGALVKKLEKVLVDQTATTALAARKGNVKILLPHVKAALKVVEENDDFHVKVQDGEGNNRLTVKRGATSDMTLEELIEEMASSEDFALAFDSNAKPGGGTQPTKGGGATPPAAVRRVSAEELNNAPLADIAAGRVVLAQ